LVRCLDNHSIEESDDLASDVPLSALLVGEDALGGGENEVSELSGGEDVVGPLLVVVDEDVVVGGDDSALVDAPDQLDHDLLAPVVIDDLELTNVVMLLHDSQELDENLRNGLQQHLLFALSLRIHDASQGVGKDVDLDHWYKLLK
jgi:hypothetical protein